MIKLKNILLEGKRIPRKKGQKRKSGVPYYEHCIEVCIQLINWNMDLDTIVAGLLHDTIEDTKVTKKEIKKEFNKDISDLVSGVSKLSGIKFNNSEHRQAENLMKMFLSVAKDLRVGLFMSTEGF